MCCVYCCISWGWWLWYFIACDMLLVKGLCVSIYYCRLKAVKCLYDNHFINSLHCSRMQHKESKASVNPASICKISTILSMWDLEGLIISLKHNLYPIGLLQRPLRLLGLQEKVTNSCIPYPLDLQETKALWLQITWNSLELSFLL